ncbi:MerR family transcriptional regulator [Myxococcota bacterium]|nr:MerR family transcriptional regulator [Myxococcota bacterium]
MALLTQAEIRKIEKDHAEGVFSALIVSTFRKKGERFSEATLRKYVQVGLLPKSRRVGIKGRNRGSSGLYPVGVIRLINDIKKALEKGATLSEIRVSKVGLQGEIQTLRRSAESTVARFSDAIGGGRGKAATALRKALDGHRKAIEKEIKELEKLAARIDTEGAE